MNVLPAPPPSRFRWLFYAVGAVMIGYGLLGLVTGESTSPVQSVKLLVLAVVAHDLVLVPVIALLGVLCTRAVPARWRAPVQGAAFVALSVTLVALPLVGRFGARPDDPSHLPLDYTRGYLVLLGLNAAVPVLLILWRTAMARRPQSAARRSR